MSLSDVSVISRDQFRRLLQWSSGEPDFAFLGSHGEGPDTGRSRAFTALAVDSISIDQQESLERLVRSAGLLDDEMKSITAPYLVPATKEVLFPGGWIGTISYEYGYYREHRLANQAPSTPFPVIAANLYLWTAWQDRTGDIYKLWFHPACPAIIRERVASWRDNEPPAEPVKWSMAENFAPLQTAKEFTDGVKRIRDYIHAGDCYQVNLSQQFHGRYSGSPWLAFQELTRANPTPYAAFLRSGDFSVLSVSPERFLKTDNTLIRTSPIKGTRPRGITPEQDQQLAAELLASEKDRAENLMIVDLLRNDLSIHARPGTVQVEALFALESYRNVHHLVSHIRAELRPDISPMQALLSAFPGGSITGAPKIRAMEIIHELEPHWRGPYCGSVFYWGLDGRLDSNIAIRTLLCGPEGDIWCWGGGGIVADSDPEAEYQETLTKVQPLMSFLEQDFAAG